jgi:hypothetical protein
MNERPTDPDRTHLMAVGVISALLASLVAAAAWIAAKLVEIRRMTGDERPERLEAFLWVLAFAVLALTLYLIFVLAVRVIGRRLRQPQPAEPTEYVDAWSEAGRRLELDEEDPDAQPGRDDRERPSE